MYPCQSLSCKSFFYVLALTGWLISQVFAADTAPASPGSHQPNEKSSVTTSQPAQVKQVGVVQAALRQLYTMPRPGARSSVGQSTTGIHAPAPPLQGHTLQKNANRKTPSVTTSNRLGLQHLDAIRNSKSPLPIGDDIHGAQANRSSNAQKGEEGAEPAATNVYVGVPPYYHGGQRLSPHQRSYANYRYYGGRPSRYGYGRYRRYSDDGYDGYGYGGGDSFRFGFMEGYDAGYFDRTTNERVESVLAHAGAYLERGIEMFREGQYLEAADTFQVASDMDQGSAASRIYAGHALFAIGRYRDAVRHLRRAFELQPRIAYLTYDMRGDYSDLTAFNDQYQALQTALKLSPRDPDRLFMAGYVLYYSGQRGQSYPFWSRAHQLDKSDRLVAKLMRNAQPSDIEMDRLKAKAKK